MTDRPLAPSEPAPLPQWRRWLLAARPKTLPLTLSPVIAGLALAVAATGTLAVWTALATLLAAVSIQIGTNLYNDAADFERGADTVERLGPPRATAQGWLTARQVKNAAHGMFALAFVLGLALLARGGWPILVVGLASLASGYAYTGGPRPIAYGPFGELYALLFFGVAAVGGTYYLQTLTLDGSTLVVGAALGCLAAAVLLINNYRDLETDITAGRRSLCRLIGRRRARVLYALLLLVPIPLLMLFDPSHVFWPVLAALPSAIHLIRRLWRGTLGSALNELLAQTAQYQALLVGLLILSLVLTRMG
ncbi:1,4-dihydroxy-2-naphthoate octaprenyltransferase [Thermochromatium tepidum]|uniref:1,4-dihydroxy-2-naphthoate octaprenyltransferase n=1 Tax=Thermochromatium tepidum ATCC 43061 TaxID=316276 RepID=A0A6I6EEW2_THETI|nr:1,4-dihydroxy-2-naphthoate octaprenyltransferase [Thermochromatium tepidum]QGU32720.1 1,4-dihydroxy-2-naphthoate octaprenyltransferase [Thermochromatium tepidum ATCC 43061]